MRKVFYIATSIVILGIIITGCNIAHNHKDINSSGKSDFRALGIPVDDSVAFDLIGGQHINIGDIYLE